MRRHRLPYWAVGWLFKLEYLLLKLEQPTFDLLRDRPARRQPWATLRAPVSRVTRWLEGSRG